MVNSTNNSRQSMGSNAGFFSIFPILGKLMWRYGRRLLSVDTLVALEKKQGEGSGERSVEVELLEQSLERNKHHYHIDPANLGLSKTQLPRDLRSPVLYVKKEADDDRNG